MIDTEQQDWTRGYWAARRWSSREGHLRVPLAVTTEWGYPLGRWIRWQRAACASGQLDGRQAARLERLGMVWDPAEADWQDNLAAARLYMGRHGTLAAPRNAMSFFELATDRVMGREVQRARPPGC
ncbi:helicase associated domain-containing protein [Streptomyces sp. NPDC007369]|uniref:helicase associated domain-containing protein n=1 Tax=Streptomyces sp. NPDC007369 TaxID=3154589 RepID=UPI0033E0DEF9